MKIMVDVLRAEQSWDLDTHEQQNYLVIQALGIEMRVPCSEDELVRALTAAGASGHPEQEYRPGRDEAELEEVPFEMPDEDTPVAPPTTFVGDEPEEDAEEAPPSPKPAPQRRRALAPVRRQRGDDAGIAQG